MYSHAEARYCYSSIRHAQNIHWLIATGSITNRYYEVCTRLSLTRVSSTNINGK